jgi:hypothetical protein
MKAIFTGKGGWEGELDRAKNTFEVGKSYTIKKGYRGRYDSTLMFEELPGYWNSVLFEFDEDKLEWEYTYYIDYEN